MDGVYRHYSTNGHTFELNCFKRWFALRDVVSERGIEEVFVLDSDVMLYATENEMRDRIGSSVTLGLCMPRDQDNYRWIASPHVSFWTRSRIDEFCDFIVRSYTDNEMLSKYEDKWQYHLENRIFGGICDMTALYLFAQSIAPDTFSSLSRVADGVAHDQNMNTSENHVPAEYVMERAIKRIAFDEHDRPWGENLVLGGPVRFLDLHFQGKAKEYMPAFYRGPRFPGQGAIRRHLMRYYRARRLASRFVQPARLLLGRLGAK
jgi:hypothetical protein